MKTINHINNYLKLSILSNQRKIYLEKEDKMVYLKMITCCDFNITKNRTKNALLISGCRTTINHHRFKRTVKNFGTAEYIILRTLKYLFYRF